MATKTFSNPAGGSWETPGNWTQSGVPGVSDDALINATGSAYTVTLGAVEGPNSVTLNSAVATLSISASGELIGSPLTLNTGTLAVAGLIEGSTIVDKGGVFAPSGGTLDGVTWQGAFAGPASTFATVSIKDGITLLNQAGTAPGTMDIGSLYMVTILDSTPLSDMTINFDAFNNEYLIGSSTLAMNVDTTTTINQSLPSASGQIEGAKLVNDGTFNASGLNSSMFIESTVFDNAGTMLVSGGDHVSVLSGFGNTGTVAVSSTGKLTISDAASNALSNTGTISVASGGSLVVSGSLGGSGVITLANLAVVDLTNTANTDTFLDAKGTLRLETPGTFTGKISGLQKGDKIDLLATAVTKLSYAGTTASGVLTVMNNGTTVAALSLVGDYTQSTFAFAGDGAANPGNNITVAVTSMAARTLGWTGGNGTTAFNAPANWNDISDALNPALTAPGTVDTVLFNTGGGAISGTSTVAVVEVGKSGVGVLQLSGGAVLAAGSLDVGVAAADVGQIGVSGSGTSLNINGPATIADDGTGVLSVLSGGTFAATNLTIGSLTDSSGAVVVSGTGSVINVTGALNIGTSLGTGDLTVGPGAAIHAGVINQFGDVVDEGGLLDPTVLLDEGTDGGTGTIASDFIIDEGTIAANSKKAANGVEVVSGTVVGGGPLTISGGTTLDGTTENSPGLLLLDNIGTLEVQGPVLNAADTTFSDNGTPSGSVTVFGTYEVVNSVVDVQFLKANEVLVLDDISGFNGTVTTTFGGDKIVITGGTLSNLAVSNSDTLTMSDSGTAGGTDRIMFAGPVSATGFNIVNGNTLQVVACFAAGTRIETTDGPVAVEDLPVGGGVVTAGRLGSVRSPNDKRCEPIVWIGQRTVDCTRHPKPETVWPVRVSAHAFGRNVPVRDLYLSPDHAVFVNDVLVPVKLLVNGSSIAQAKRDRVTYYHVELPEHALILAEGLTVESYLDLGDRANFHGGGETIRLFPDFAARLAPDTALMWETRAAAPLVMAGKTLARARRLVAAYEARRPFRSGAGIASGTRLPGARPG